jgi:hypothetical protein
MSNAIDGGAGFGLVIAGLLATPAAAETFVVFRSLPPLVATPASPPVTMPPLAATPAAPPNTAPAPGFAAFVGDRNCDGTYQE